MAFRDSRANHLVTQVYMVLIARKDAETVLMFTSVHTLTEHV